MSDQAFPLSYFLRTLRRRKWLILGPTVAAVGTVAIVSLLLPRKWEIDVLILPSKFLAQTEQGQYTEVVIVDPQQIAGQINNAAYNAILASKLNLPPRKIPRLRAENIRNTKLVLVSLRHRNIDLGKKILALLFDHLKSEFDMKIEVEIKTIDSEILTREKEIVQKKIDIRSRNIDISLAEQKIASAQIKQKISERLLDEIGREFDTVKAKVQEIGDQQKKALEGGKGALEAMSLLLYANVIQQNIQYQNILSERLSQERVTLENLRLSVKEEQEGIKQLKTQVEGLENEIEIINHRIALLKDKKKRIDPTELVKEPTASFKPAFPNVKANILFALIFGLLLFTTLALFLENTDGPMR